MRKLLSLLTLLVGFYASAQISGTTIEGLNTRIGRPNNAWFLISIGGQTYKLDINNIASNKLDNVVLSHDSLFQFQNGIKTLIGKLPTTSSGGGTGGGGTGGTGNVNVYTLSANADGKHQDIPLYVGSSTVTNIEVTSPTGNPTDANGTGWIAPRKAGDTLYLHYPIAPKGVINYQITLLGTIGSGSAFVAYGALFGLGTTTLNMSALANAGLQNVRVPYNGSGTASYVQYGSAGYKVHLSYNPLAPVHNGYATLPTDTVAFKARLDSLLSANPTTNITIVSIINEINNIQHGLGYWNTSAANMINLLNAAATIVHAHGLLMVDGGFAGDVFKYMVWEDYINTGHADSAAAYLAAVFPAGTNLTGWRADTAHGYRIRYMDTILAALPSLRSDKTQLHWYETSRDADSLNSSINTLPFKQSVAYLRRKSGKKVISLEIGTNNNANATILGQMLDACEAIYHSTGDMEIVDWYSGAPSPYSLTLADGSLTALGTAYKNKIIQIQSN